ncbi:MSMEG_4193 family putative phosphomutase [Nakamurella lactea]|uniref:MSMEG_4193 family putative phosphomutase n=1 Tax=Nakamurella lactea TaxID=459515 RepID=UPI00041F0239|nr:MSMEG_4193 family putative phosphomutase [Nakamurella lactea]
MTAARTVVLLRHARSVANAASVLAGRSAGVGLDEVGVEQAAGLPGRLAEVPIARLVSSPLERCLRTLAPLAEATGLTVEQDPALAEVDYGEWTGRPLRELFGEPMWKTVQGRPSAAVFPGGESLAAVSARAVAALHRLIETTTDDGALLICSHGDVIKALLADALGLHLDLFQRISVGPASVSVIRFVEHRPFVERMGDNGTLSGIVAVPDPATPADQAVPGGDPGIPAPPTADPIH